MKNQGGELRLRKDKNILLCDYRKPTNNRLHRSFEPRIYGRFLIVHLSEQGIVDHSVTVNYRRCPGLIYNFVDPHPAYLFSISLYHCGGTDVLKLKITHIYETIIYRERKHS